MEKLNFYIPPRSPYNNVKNNAETFKCRTLNSAIWRDGV